MIVFRIQFGPTLNWNPNSLFRRFLNYRPITRNKLLGGLSLLNLCCQTCKDAYQV